ncbi:MAG: hypothetical protein QOH93_2962 [Chloroflexia bacterium]|nr:hypothetical protein [Chloroflexia bacterium]
MRADLKGADLRRVSLRGAYLTGAYLTEARLRRVNLASAYLRGADLTRADLTEADLTEADLTRADLTGGDLTGANLTAANLTAANLREAKLFGTNFTYAYFKDTNFSEVSLRATVFGDVNFRFVNGLEAAKHLGPSVIGIGTFYRSEGQIPETFLRGAGIPEGFIESIRLMTEQPPPYYSAFISYSHNDQTFARRLYDGLQVRGIRCWLDDKDIAVGEDIYEAVDRGIKGSDKLLLCCSRSSLTSWWVDDEIGKAFEKEQKVLKETGNRVRVLIPLDLDGYLRKEWMDGKSTQVKRRLAADFKDWEGDNAKFEEQFERVVGALRTDVDPR